MTRILEAEARIKATDATGGTFEAIANKVARLGAAARAVSRELDIARAASNKVASLPSFDHRAAAGRQAVYGRAAAIAHGAKSVGGGLAALGTANAMRSTMHELARAAAEGAHERVRMDVAGMTPDEIKEVEKHAAHLSEKYKSLSQTSIMHAARNIRSVVGSVEEATHILDPLIKLRVLAEGARPDRADDIGHDFDQLIKGMEIKGVTQDMGKFMHYLDGMARAINVFGDTLRATDYYEMFKYGRAATTALSDDFILKTAPTLAQELGGSSTGKALSSFYQQFVGGKMSNIALKTLAKYGLIDETKVERTKTGLIKGVHPGGIVGGEYLTPGNADPYQWVNKVLLPALAKKGVTDPAEIQQIIAAISSQQTTAQLLSIFATQQSRIEKNERLGEKAKGLDAADRYLSNDPITGAKAVGRQFDNFLQVASEPAMPAVGATLNAVASGLSMLTAASKDSPAVGLTALGTAIVTTAAAVAHAASYMFPGLSGAAPWLLRAVPPAAATVAGSEIARQTIKAATPLVEAARGQFWTPKDLQDTIMLGDDLAAAERKAAQARRGGKIDGLGDTLAAPYDAQAADLRNRIQAGWDDFAKSTGRMSEATRDEIARRAQVEVREAQKVELQGKADVNVSVKVEAGEGLLARVTNIVTNAIGHLRATGAPQYGTVGATGSSMPEAGPAP